MIAVAEAIAVVSIAVISMISVVAIAVSISMVSVVPIVAHAAIAAVSTIAEVSVTPAFAASVVTTCESVAHASACMASVSEVTSMIPAASAIHPPAMTSAIDSPEMGMAKVEVVTVRVAGIDAEVPVAGFPVEGTIEVGSCHEGVVLPVEQDVAQVKVALCPIDAIQVVDGIDAHQVVKVHLVGGLVLLLGEVQLVCHLVGEEQCLLAGLLVTHCVG